LAALPCPDPLAELERSPRPLAAIWGPTSKGRGREKRRREERGGREGKKYRAKAAKFGRLMLRYVD